ncbi:MAG: hypothetical protein GX096_01565 [Clostridiales bacterium]|nr:hypothetical protein [Clostridiales bacterium]
MAYLDNTGLARFFAGLKNVFVAKTSITNNLTTTAAGLALDARQGLALNTAIGTKATTARYTATLSTTWSGAGPYTQTVTVSGMLAADTPIVDLVASTTKATAILQAEAWACVGKITTAANAITVTCFEDKPTTAIPIQLKVVR